MHRGNPQHRDGASASATRWSFFRGQFSKAGRISVLTVVIACACLALGLPRAGEAAESLKWGTVLADDYDRGVAEHKPIVVLFYDIRTSRLDADTLSMRIQMSATLGKAAGSAVWSFADISNDLVASNIAKALGIKTFPTISVLRSDPNALDETCRVVGMLSMASTEVGVMRGIDKATKK